MKTTRQNKFSYNLVIQQNYGFGWEDNSEYTCNSLGTPKEFIKDENGVNKVSLYRHDLKEYNLTGYATRTILRKELNKTL